MRLLLIDQIHRKVKSLEQLSKRELLVPNSIIRAECSSLSKTQTKLRVV